MANATYTPGLGDGDGSVKVFSWTLTTADPTGGAVLFPEYADVCWSATGTWGGATLTVQGSNDAAATDATFLALSNAAGGTAATATADKLLTVIERPLYERPKLTTVGVGASVVVTAVLRRANPLRT